MARNKFPEETRIKILDTASRLFLEKGIQNTTIQDIVDNLNGLSKGAIYHHFKNKEDLEIAVFEYFFSGSQIRARLAEIANDENSSAAERFLNLLHANLNDPHETAFRKMAPDVKKNPYYLSKLMDRWINVDAPLFILPVIEQAMAEGSLKTNFPKQYSEFIVLLTSIWLNPTLYPVSNGEYRDKIMFLIELIQKLNIEIDLNPESFMRFQTDTLNE